MDAPVQIRRAVPDDAGGIARVHVDSWRTTYSGIVADEVLENLSVDARDEYWSNALSIQDSPATHYVANDPASGVVGFASAGPERDGIAGYSSELFAIYLLETAQGQGLGKRLVREIVGDLIETGHRSMLVWVLAENPSRHFYAALGGRQVASKMVSMGPADLEEIAFGWDNLSSLAHHLETGRGEYDANTQSTFGASGPLRGFRTS